MREPSERGSPLGSRFNEDMTRMVIQLTFTGYACYVKQHGCETEEEFRRKSRSVTYVKVGNVADSDEAQRWLDGDDAVLRTWEVVDA